MIKRKIISPITRRRNKATQEPVVMAEPALPEVLDEQFAVPLEDDIVVAAAAKQSKKQEKRENLLRKLRIVSFACLGLIVFGLALSAILYLTRAKPEETVQAENQLKISLMGAKISFIDGVVQTSKDNAKWQDASLDDQVTEGTILRTKEYSRATVTLGDGSVVRLDNVSTIKIDVLEDKTIAITNLAGKTYARLATADSELSINVADESYVATDAAYITLNTTYIKGAEVYEGKIKLTKNELAVPVGMYFYAESKDTKNLKKVTTTAADKMSTDEFLIWNYEQDKTTETFKGKAGFMSKLDSLQSKQAIVKEQKKQEAADYSDKIKLTATKYDAGINLNWTISDLKAPLGYKIVKGVNEYPTVGTGEATTISDPNVLNYLWAIRDGETYNFRVCIISATGCELYSNDVEIDTPKGTEPIPEGSIELTHTSGANVTWKTTGYAPYGYKLVWAKTSGVPYASANSKFYGADLSSGNIDAANGSYYVRICMFTASDCVNASKEIFIKTL